VNLSSFFTPHKVTDLRDAVNASAKTGTFFLSVPALSLSQVHLAFLLHI
jgi:hypothetical protein